MPRQLTLLLAGLLLAACGGCNLLAFPAYVLAPAVPGKSVPAEFDGLKKKTVAVVVYAGPETQLDYQMAVLEISDAINAELKRKIDKVTTVDPRRVMRYQDETPGWECGPMEKLCQAFNADYVLLISLMEFSMREPGSLHLSRGRIKAEATLYAAGLPATQPGQSRGVWRADAVGAVYPPDSPVGVSASQDYKTRTETEKLFAQDLVKKFYKHETPVEAS